MNAKVPWALLALLSAFCGVATAERREAWRSIPALGEFQVTHCLGDRSLVWVTSSRAEHRALFTPELYEKCNSGTGVMPVWPCCPPGQTHAVFRSRQELERHFDAMYRNPALVRSLPERRAWVDAYLQTVDRLVDFDEETLVLSSTPYGATGMATASLDFEALDGVLTARIRIRVPPPPLTPDTAMFRFAFAVSRAEVARVVIVTEHPAVPDLGVAGSTERTPPFPI